MSELPMTPEEKEIYHLYHVLWTKAVGTQDYDKKEWKKLGELLEKKTNVRF
jgi:hypothetical protein